MKQIHFWAHFQSDQGSPKFTMEILLSTTSAFQGLYTDASWAAQPSWVTQRLWIGRALNGITSSSTGGSSSWPSPLLYFISRSSSSPWPSFLFSVSSTTLAPLSVFKSPHSFSTHDIQSRTHPLSQSPVGTRLPLSSKAQVHLHRGQPVVRLRQLFHLPWQRKAGNTIQETWAPENNATFKTTSCWRHTTAPLTVTVFSPRKRSIVSSFKLPSRDGVSRGTWLTLIGFSDGQRLCLLLNKRLPLRREYILLRVGVDLRTAP